MKFKAFRQIIAIILAVHLSLCYSGIAAFAEAHGPFDDVSPSSPLYATMVSLQDEMGVDLRVKPGGLKGKQAFTRYECAFTLSRAYEQLRRAVKRLDPSDAAPCASYSMRICGMSLPQADAKAEHSTSILVASFRDVSKQARRLCRFELLVNEFSDEERQLGNDPQALLTAIRRWKRNGEVYASRAKRLPGRQPSDRM